MALGNAPILGNVANHPVIMAKALIERPTILCDETTETVKAVAKTLARKGLRAELHALSESAGLDAVRREIVKAACSFGVVH